MTENANGRILLDRAERFYPGRIVERPWDIGKYRDITELEGEPYHLRFKEDYGDLPTVIFNEHWNAAFMAMQYRVELNPENNRFRIFLRAHGLVECSDEKMRSFLSQELADYWRNFHSGEVEYLLPLRRLEMLDNSIRILRGRLEDVKKIQTNSIEGDLSR